MCFLQSILPNNILYKLLLIRENHVKCKITEQEKQPRDCEVRPYRAARMWKAYRFASMTAMWIGRRLPAFGRTRPDDDRRGAWLEAADADGRWRPGAVHQFDVNRPFVLQPIVVEPSCNSSLALLLAIGRKCFGDLPAPCSALPWPYAPARASSHRLPS